VDGGPGRPLGFDPATLRRHAGPIGAVAPWRSAEHRELREVHLGRRARKAAWRRRFQPPAPAVV